MDGNSSTNGIKQVGMARTGYSFNTVTLINGTGDELKEVLEKKVAPYASAYENTPVVIDVAYVNYLKDLDYPLLSRICKEYGMHLIGLSGAVTEDRAQTLYEMDIPLVNSSRFARMREENFKPRVITKTLEVKVPVHIKEPYEVRVPYEVRNPEPMLIIDRNIRAGELISAPGNSVVIFGNVGNTARVIASHNVLIFGDLYGEIYAGSPKDQHTEGMKSAFVYVKGQFEPTLMAIAGQYQTADDMISSQMVADLYGKKHSLRITLEGKSLTYKEI
ncbi:MAG: septum site-determining protein MinC [Succinivibrio sp.]